MFSGW